MRIYRLAAGCIVSLICLLIFSACVHELAHAVCYRLAGIPWKDIHISACQLNPCTTSPAALGGPWAVVNGYAGGLTAAAALLAIYALVRRQAGTTVYYWLGATLMFLVGYQVMTAVMEGAAPALYRDPSKLNLQTVLILVGCCTALLFHWAACVLDRSTSRTSTKTAPQFRGQGQRYSVSGKGEQEPL